MSTEELVIAQRVDMLESLALLAAARVETIEEVKVDRAKEKTRHREQLRDFRWRIRAANRVLVDAIEEGARRGLRRADIYARCGISHQRFYQIKHAIAAWEKEERRIEHEHDQDLSG